MGLNEQKIEKYLFWSVLIFLFISFTIDSQDNYQHFLSYIYLVGLIFAFAFPFLGVIAFTGSELFSQVLLDELRFIFINITSLGFLIILIIFLFTMVKNKGFLDKKFHINHILALGLVFIAVISTLINEQLIWYTNYDLMTGYFEGFLIYLSIVYLVSNAKQIRWFIWAFIAIGSGMVIRVWQLGGWETSLFGLENNQVAKIFLPIFALVIFAFWAEKDKKLKGISLFMSVIFLHTLVNLLGSRATYVALVILGILMLIRRSNKISTWAAVVLVIIFLSVKLAPTVAPEFMSIQEAQYGKEADPSAGSISARAMILENGFEIFKENPVLGFGPASFESEYGKRYGRNTAAHNAYLEIAVETGFFGFVFYILILIGSLVSTFYAIRNFKRQGNTALYNFTIGAEIGLVSYMVNMLFINHPVEPITWILVGLCTSLYIISKEPAQEEIEQKPKIKKLLKK